MSKILIFSLALNGYQHVFDRCIASHRDYASRHGYEYVCITGIPGEHPSPAEAAWIKIPLILSRLQAGFEWIFFVDADCEIKPDCPPIQTLESSGKSLYFVKGFSGKVNSGVMIIRNSPDALQFYQDALDSCESLVPREYQALWENGHIVYLAHRYAEWVEILPLQRNNTADPTLKDYIRHYSDGGGMRSHYRGSLLGRFATFGVKVLKKLRKKPGAIDTWIGLKESIVRIAGKVKW